MAREGTVGRVGCGEGMWVGQREEIRKGTRLVLEVNEICMLWWKFRRFGSASSG